MVPDIASALELVTFVFVGTIVISIIFTVVLLIWTFARISERSSTRDLVRELKGPDNAEPPRQNASTSEEDIQKMIMQSVASILRDTGVTVNESVQGLAPPPPPPPQPSLQQSIADKVRQQFNAALQPSVEQQETPTSAPAPDSRSNALLRTGHVHLKHGDVESAINDYTAALRLTPTVADAFNARGMAYRRQRDFQHALQDYTMALNLRPDLAATFNNRGVIHMDIKQYELALSDFDKAIELDPNNANGYCNRAMVYGYIGDYDKSITESTRATEINPQLSESYVVRGIAKVRIGAEGSANQDFDVAETLGHSRNDINLRVTTAG